MKRGGVEGGRKIKKAYNKTLTMSLRSFPIAMALVDCGAPLLLYSKISPQHT